MAAERIGAAWDAVWEAGVWEAGVWEPVDEIGPTPDANTSGFGRRRIASYIKRGGVGALRGRVT